MLLSALFLISFHGQAHAGTRDADATAAALQQTQAMMNDPKAIEAYTKDHADARAADAKVKSLTGGNAQDTAAIYGLASQIMGTLTTENGGDAEKMQAELEKALKNPQGFAAKLTPAQQAELKAIATKIESRAPTASPH